VDSQCVITAKTHDTYSGGLHFVKFLGFSIGEGRVRFVESSGLTVAYRHAAHAQAKKIGLKKSDLKTALNKVRKSSK